MQSSMLTRTAVSWMALALCVAALSPVSARADERVVVLGLRSGDGLLAEAASITRALREVSREMPGWQVLPRDEFLSELMAYHRCSEPDARCLTRIGLTLGADRVLFGTVRPVVDGNGLAVTLYAFDCYAARLVATVTDAVATSTGEAIIPDTTLARWLTELSVRRQPRVEPVAVERAPALTAPRVAVPAPPTSPSLVRYVGWGLLGGAGVSAIVSFGALQGDETYVRGSADKPFPWSELGMGLAAGSILMTLVGALLLVTDDQASERERRRALQLSADLAPDHAVLDARVAF